MELPCRGKRSGERGNSGWAECFRAIIGNQQIVDIECPPSSHQNASICQKRCGMPGARVQEIGAYGKPAGGLANYGEPGSTCHPRRSRANRACTARPCAARSCTARRSANRSCTCRTRSGHKLRAGAPPPSRTASRAPERLTVFPIGHLGVSRRSETNAHHGKIR